MKLFIPLVAGALLAGGLVGCDDTATTETTTTTERRTTAADRDGNASVHVDVDKDRVKDNLNAAGDKIENAAERAADATKRGLERTGDAIRDSARKAGDAVDRNVDVDVKTNDSTRPAVTTETRTTETTTTPPANQ